MKSSMRKFCLRAYSRIARRWLHSSGCAVETLKIGNGFHALTMKDGFWYFI